MIDFEALKNSNEMGFVWIGSFLHRIQLCGGEDMFNEFKSPLTSKSWLTIDLLLGIFPEEDTVRAAEIEVEIKSQDGTIACISYDQVRLNFDFHMGSISVRDGKVLIEIGDLTTKDFPLLYGGKAFYAYFWQTLNILENIFQGYIGSNFQDRKYYLPYVEHGDNGSFIHESKWEYFIQEFEEEVSKFLGIESEEIRKMNFFEVYFLLAETFEFIGPPRIESGSGEIIRSYGIWDQEFSYDRLGSWPDPRAGNTYSLR
jgi:hypothetical protein